MYLDNTFQYEYFTNKLTITQYQLLYGTESVSGKDFDIYLRGLKVDTNFIDGYIDESTKYIVIYVTKNIAVEDGYTETDFEIVSKFDGIYIGLDGGEDWLDTEDNNDILVDK